MLVFPYPPCYTGTMMRTQNITATFRAAPTADKADGITWYSRALDLARELDPHNVRRGCAVIAVLSPMLSWPRNMQLARKAYAMHGAAYLGMVNPFLSPDMAVVGFGCLNKNAHKAFSILAGGDIDKIVSGPKVTSFFANIIAPDAIESVTIDRHAIDIAMGRAMSDSERAKAIAGKDGYKRIAKMYVSAATILSREIGVSLTPNQVQAVTWVYWRKTHAQANHG